MAVIQKDLGIATAYGYAKSKGYTGTEEEFAELMASYATVAETAVAAKEAAVVAQGKAEDAEENAEKWATGSTGGTPGATNNAEYYAEQASGSATTASTKAGEASGSANTASQKATAASGSADAAAADALKAEGYAQGKQNGSDVASGSPYYHANAKYFSEQAGSSATTADTKAGEASGSASTAGEKALVSEGFAVGKQNGTDVASGSLYYENNAKYYAQKAHDYAESVDPDELAHVDGYYEEMAVGNAEQLIATVGITDKAPYNFRTAGGSADIGDRMTDKLIGGTVAWNQLLDQSRFSESGTDNGITFTNNGDGSVTISGTASDRAVFSLHGVFATQGHVYLLDPSVDVSGVWIGNSTWGANGKIFKQTAISANAGINIMVASGTAITGSIKLYPNVFDLTQMFGETIAEYIRTLESTTAGAGVAWFRKLFPKPYYDYNAGELMSVQAASHNTVGFNAWDEEWELGIFNYETGAEIDASNQIRSKNYIPVVPNTTYYIKIPGSVLVLGYDANKNFLRRVRYNSGNATFLTRTLNGDDCYYIRFCTMDTPAYGNTYNHDICINLSWDGERDGEYEPYVKHSYPLGNVELRGILKLDANNELYYDGDEYASDGTVVRRYGVVTIGDLTWGKVTDSLNGKYVFYAPNILQPNVNTPVKIICAKYVSALSPSDKASSAANSLETGMISRSYGTSQPMLYIKDNNYETAADFKTAMSSVEIVYELATPTTESSDPFQNPQIVDDFGTEEYVDRGVTASTPTRDVAIPVGHESTYQANLRAKLEMSPDSPGDGDGDYIVRQTNGENEYVKLAPSMVLPASPSDDGNYILTATFSGTSVTYAWTEISSLSEVTF